MYIQTEGIVLRQVKTAFGRRMITLFTKEHGKISCGTSINEGGKNKTALALRPFTFGRYELYKNGENYNIVGAETLKSFYAIGEDVDKFMCASFVLELTDKVLMEEQVSENIFNLLENFLELLKDRKASFQTLVIGYQVKLLRIAGVAASMGLAEADEPLKSEINPDIIQTVGYFETHRLKDLENLALKPDFEKKLKHILKVYYADALGVANLKSEALLI